MKPVPSSHPLLSGFVIDIVDDEVSGELEPSGRIEITSVLKAPLHAWWNLRQELYYSDAQSSEAWLHTQIEALDLQRDAIRCAFHQRSVTGRNEQHIQSRLAASLESPGGAMSTLLSLIRHSREPFFRVSHSLQCPECKAYKVAPADLSKSAQQIFISQQRLSAARGNPFVALQQLILEVGKMNPPQECAVCNTQVRFVRAVQTSADTASSPAFLLLELPETAVHRYDITPAVQELRSIHRPLGSFQLVGMLRYHRDYHFIADICDPRDGWMRCDGMTAQGVACRIEPGRGRIEHTDGVEYHPIMVVYALVC